MIEVNSIPSWFSATVSRGQSSECREQYRWQTAGSDVKTGPGATLPHTQPSSQGTVRSSESLLARSDKLLY